MRRGFLRFGLVIAAVAAWGTGCHRQTGPDPRFERAFAAFVEAESERGDAAFQDPRADEALAAARAVSPSSVDHVAAQALVLRIEKGREEQAAFAAGMKAAGQPPPEPPAPSFPATPSTAQTLSRTASARPPSIGSAEADFHARYGTCVAPLAPFHEKGGERQGTAWALAEGCEKRFPELEGVAVAILDGKVFNVIPRSMFPPAAANAPAPADAGTP